MDEGATDSTPAVTRRSALGATGALVGGVPVGAVASRDAVTTYELGADVGGWVGRSPDAIAGVTNPLLWFAADETYEVVYENLDGPTHDFQVLDDGEEVLVDGGDVSGEGDANSVRFTASEAMTGYRCHYHPSSMAGTVVACDLPGCLLEADLALLDCLLGTDDLADAVTAWARGGISTECLARIVTAWARGG